MNQVSQGNSNDGIPGRGTSDKAPAAVSPESNSSSGKKGKSGKRSQGNSKTKANIWCSLREDEAPLWYNPDLSVFARLIKAAYDAIEDRGLSSAAVVVSRNEFAICCYWYLYATWFATYSSFWNAWNAPYPQWMRGTPRQYAAVFANLKVPAVIHQAVMSVITPMKASGQIFYPCPGNLDFPVNYDDDGDPVAWEDRAQRHFVNRETARYQVNFGNAYQNIINGPNRDDGNLANVLMTGFPGYDYDPPDPDFEDPHPNVHDIRSSFDFGFRYCVMPRLMLRMVNFLETIGLRDKEVVSYNTVRDVPAPQDMTFTSFGIGVGVRPLPPGYVTTRSIIYQQEPKDLVEEINTWSLALFTVAMTRAEINRINPGEVNRCFVLENPRLYLSAHSTNGRWFSYLPEMVRLNLSMATLTLTDFNA
jgi:hypothetical protein